MNGRDGVDGRTPNRHLFRHLALEVTIVITNPEGVTTETTVINHQKSLQLIEQNGTLQDFSL